MIRESVSLTFKLLGTAIFLASIGVLPAMREQMAKKAHQAVTQGPMSMRKLNSILESGGRRH